jgi:hypothetical protein
LVYLIYFILFFFFDRISINKSSKVNELCEEILKKITEKDKGGFSKYRPQDLIVSFLFFNNFSCLFIFIVYNNFIIKTNR